jgi:hypothetical protein
MNVYSRLFGLLVAVIGGVLGLASLIMVMDMVGLSPF